MDDLPIPVLYTYLLPWPIAVRGSSRAVMRGGVPIWLGPVASCSPGRQCRHEDPGEKRWPGGACAPGPSPTAGFPPVSPVSTTARHLSGGGRLVLSCLLGLGLAGFTVAMVLPTIDHLHQYATLRSRGMTTTTRIGYYATAQNSQPVSVTVTCPGTFTVRGSPVTENIPGLPAPLQAGATLLVMAGPQDTRDVYP
jgi:hypothetical protein